MIARTATAAAVLVGLLGGPTAAASDPADVAAFPPLLDPPRLPAGPVCSRDREHMVQAAERYLQEAVQRVDDLGRRLTELERDPKVPRARVDALRDDKTQADNHRRDLEAYRDVARGLPLTLCSAEGTGPVLNPPRLTVPAGPPIAVVTPPVVGLAWNAAPTCRPDTPCTLALRLSSRRPTTDQRRAAVVIEAPAGASLEGAAAGGLCTATAAGALCLIPLGDLDRLAAAPVELAWRFRGGETEARVCARAPKFADGRASQDPERMRIVAALLGRTDVAPDAHAAETLRPDLIAAVQKLGFDRANVDDDRLIGLLLAGNLAEAAVAELACTTVPLNGAIAGGTGTGGTGTGGTGTGGTGTGGTGTGGSGTTVASGGTLADLLRAAAGSKRKRVIEVEDPPAQGVSATPPTGQKLIFGKRGAIPFGF